MRVFINRVLHAFIRRTPPPRLTAAEVLAQLCAVQDTIQRHAEGDVREPLRNVVMS